TVTGTDNQVISGRGNLIRHSGDFHVGVQTRAYVGEENKTSTIDLIAVDWQGNRLANKSIEVSIVRREWDNRFVPNEFGGGDWQYDQKDVPITTAAVTTNDKGEATFDYTPPQAGSYKITAKAVDGGGREIRASVFQWVTGREFVSWRRENNDRLTLISDKSSYVPGETARILIPSPFQGEHWALVSIERGGILRRELVKITSNSQIYELPITNDLAPNVYVSIVLVKGQDATNKLSDYKVGLLPIDVKPIAQKLTVTLTPDRTTAQPGETVTYTVQVADSSGAAIQAEFSLDLVDKAVLSLLPRTPDEIVEAFYGRRGLGVNTSSGLSVSVNRFNEQLRLDQEQQQIAQRQFGAVGGAAEAPMAAMPAPQATATASDAAKSADGYRALNALPPGVEVRQEFADTAYWNPQISTDAAGQASVAIKLPDNLTTWTFRGVGVTRDTKVGEATIDVVATKPLLIRPVTPRFFVVGDKAELAANVSNNTDNPLSVTLTLSATGVSLLSEGQQIIEIPAKSEGAATWTVEAQDVESAQLVFIAQSGDFVDASKPRLATGPDGSLKVYRYTAPDIVGTAGQIKEGGARTEIIALPQNVDVTKGEVSVQIDPSLAAGMINGLDYLEHYPYECAEQTVSRFLPNVLTYRALKELGISNPAVEAKLPGLVN
ncbi:MAG TPA: alpha-2-macroglobulin family protein, partial [Anaerolineae bacterium]|nr:alpha-2-macroglobulin family protein [Anaerolineae bacterium]